MKDTIRRLFSRDWTLAEKCLFAADALLLGVLIGWITSPLKGGMNVFGNNVWDINSACNENEDTVNNEEEEIK